MSELFQPTLEMLQNRSAKLVLKQIAVGAGIPYPWLCAFHQGRLKNEYKVSEVRLKKLHDYLVKKKKEQAELL